MREKTAEDYLFEITCFLIASSQRCLGPEREYGACRLVEALYKLSFLPDYVHELRGNELLMKVRAYVDSDPQNFWREPQLKRFLSELSLELAKELRKRKGMER
ncbi:MAG: hypothetical protein ACE5OW_03065 [Candidatus Bathyarchaeia archaeon]